VNVGRRKAKARAMHAVTELREEDGRLLRLDRLAKHVLVVVIKVARLLRLRLGRLTLRLLGRLALRLLGRLALTRVHVGLVRLDLAHARDDLIEHGLDLRLYARGLACLARGFVGRGRLRLAQHEWGILRCHRVVADRRHLKPLLLVRGQADGLHPHGADALERGDRLEWRARRERKG
jgi:hypothetical protein